MPPQCIFQSVLSLRAPIMTLKCCFGTHPTCFPVAVQHGGIFDTAVLTPVPQPEMKLQVGQNKSGWGHTIQYSSVAFTLHYKRQGVPLCLCMLCHHTDILQQSLKSNLSASFCDTALYTESEQALCSKGQGRRKELHTQQLYRVLSSKAKPHYIINLQRTAIVHRHCEAQKSNSAKYINSSISVATCFSRLCSHLCALIVSHYCKKGLHLMTSWTRVNPSIHVL